MHKKLIHAIHMNEKHFTALSRQLVRKKAVMAMHRIFLLLPESVAHLEDDFRRSLSDQDPGVMEASLLLFHDLIKVHFRLGVEYVVQGKWLAYGCCSNCI